MKGELLTSSLDLALPLPSWVKALEVKSYIRLGSVNREEGRAV